MKVVIIGGGPTGLFASLLMLPIFKDITVVEKRNDLRLSGEVSHKRSINIVLTSRGLWALEKIGLKEEMLALAVPVRGRVLHRFDRAARQRSTMFVPYGVEETEVIYAISRTELTKLLLSRAEEQGVRILFDHTLTSIDLKEKEAFFSVLTPTGVVVEQSLQADLFIGADGLNSHTRSELARHLAAHGNDEPNERMESSGLMYREVVIPAVSTTTPEGTARSPFALEPHGMHVWSNGSHSFVASPNRDGSFTGTFFFSESSTDRGDDALPPDAEVPEPHEVLGNQTDAHWAARLECFLDHYYPELYQLAPDVFTQLGTAHAYSLKTVFVSNWYVKGRLIVIGDAAHGITPLLGQGLNHGAESALLLSEAIGRHLASAPTPRDDPIVQQAEEARYGRVHPQEKQLEAAFAAFQRFQKPSSDAIAKMDMEKYSEMALKLPTAAFQTQKRIESFLETRHASIFRSRFFLITQTLVPYQWIEKLDVHICAMLEDVLKLCYDVGRAEQGGTHEASGCLDATRLLQEPAVVESLLKKLSYEETERVIQKHVRPFFDKHSINLKERKREYLV